MAAVMEFCMLGPMVVRRDGAVLPLPAGKQRAVLAALLLSHGQVITIERLAEALWGQLPPPSARVTVRNYVKRLRYALAGTGGERISTEPGGYLIRALPDEIDVSRFEVLAAAARAAVRDRSWHVASAHARAALALWRGEPLADASAEALALHAVPRLAEVRLQIMEARINADLHLGRHADVIPELLQLAVTYPLREQLHGLLMLALYQCGRQAEAHGVYHHVRQMLAQELGAEPGAGLRELHRQMLAADPTLTVRAKVASFPASGGAGSSGGPRSRADLIPRRHDRLAGGPPRAPGFPHARDRLIMRTQAYLDGCQREGGSGRLAGPGATPALPAEVTRHNDELSQLAAPEFAAMGRAYPELAARLWAVMTAEVAKAESATGVTQPQLRAALADYLGM